MDLINDQGELHFTVYFWGKLLELGRLYDWKPAGTLPPESDFEEGTADSWDGNYVVNGGERVTAEDAAGWAAALERALDDIPNHYAAWHKTHNQPQDGKLIPYIAVGVHLSSLEALSGENKEGVKEFIAFCRQGMFTIW
jgi:hypothetical protein